MILRIINSAILILLASTSVAQSDLSATQAVFIALENNYQVQIATKNQEISEMNNTWTQAGIFPSVDLSVANNNTLQDNTENPFTFTPGIILSQSLSPSLNLNWNIFSGFSVRIGKTRLEQLEQQSANNSLTVIEATVQDVLKAYYTAQLQKERTELMRSLMDYSRSNYQYHQLKEKYSTANSLELLQFKNQYLTDSTNFLLQEISLTNSLRNLKLIMNDTTETQYNLTDPLNTELSPINFETAKADMLRENSNLKNQYISLELQQTNTNLQRAFLYPTLSFQGGVSPSWSKIREIKDDAFNIDPYTLSYYGNLNLRYTIFNNFQNRRAVQVSKIQEEIVNLQTSEMTRSLEYTLENLIDLYQVRTQLLSVSNENVEYAKQAYQVARTRYNIGAINSLDLFSFITAYQNTVIQHLENQFNLIDTYLEIYKMTGKISLNYQKN